MGNEDMKELMCAIPAFGVALFDEIMECQQAQQARYCYLQRRRGGECQFE
jgi:hypothetical protein